MRTLLLFCLLTSVARAEGSVVTWTSADGVVHFTNDPSTVPAHQRTQAVKGGEVSVVSRPKPTEAELAAEREAKARCPRTKFFPRGHQAEAKAFREACPDSRILETSMHYKKR